MAEKNQLKWWGVRPTQPLENIQTHPGPFETTVAGKTRTQIAEDFEGGPSLTVVYTVPSGKTLYIVAAQLVHFHTSPSDAFVRIQDVSNNEVLRLLTSGIASSANINVTITYPMPIVVPAGYDVAAWINVGNIKVLFFGWIE